MHFALPTQHTLIDSFEDSDDFAGGLQDDSMPGKSVFIFADRSSHDNNLLVLKLTDGRNVWEGNVSKKLKPKVLGKQDGSYLDTVRRIVERQNDQTVLVSVTRGSSESECWLELKEIIQQDVGGDATIPVCKVEIVKQAGSSRDAVRGLLGDLVAVTKAKLEREDALEKENNALRERLTKLIVTVDAKAASKEQAINDLTRKYMHVLNSKKRVIENLKRQWRKRAKQSGGSDMDSATEDYGNGDGSAMPLLRMMTMMILIRRMQKCVLRNTIETPWHPVPVAHRRRR
jgi:hypothetical protein